MKIQNNGAAINTPVIVLHSGETTMDEATWAQIESMPKVKAALESKRLMKVGAVVAAKPVTESKPADKEPAEKEVKGKHK